MTNSCLGSSEPAGFAVLPHLSPAVAPRRPSVRQAQARGGAAGHLKTGRCRAAAPASSRRLMPPGRGSPTERARRTSNQPPPHSDHRRPHLTRSTFDRITAPLVSPALASRAPPWSPAEARDTSSPRPRGARPSQRMPPCPRLRPRPPPPPPPPRLRPARSSLWRRIRPAAACP